MTVPHLAACKPPGLATAYADLECSVHRPPWGSLEAYRPELSDETAEAIDYGTQMRTERDTELANMPFPVSWSYEGRRQWEKAGAWPG